MLEVGSTTSLVCSCNIETDPMSNQAKVSRELRYECYLPEEMFNLVASNINEPMVRRNRTLSDKENCLVKVSVRAIQRAFNTLADEAQLVRVVRYI